MTESIYLPYTYRIFHIPTKRYYYGSKVSNFKDNVANPNSFWKQGGYFTSSKTVKSLIKEYGKESFLIQRIKTFKSRDAARTWESKFLQRINAANRNDWINLVNSDGKFYNKGHSEKTKAKLKKSHKGMSGKKQSAKFLEYLHNREVGPMKGKHHSEEARKRIGEYWKGKKRGPNTEEHKKKYSEWRKDKIWVNNGERNRLISKEEDYSSDWKLGRCSRNNRWKVWP